MSQKCKDTTNLKWDMTNDDAHSMDIACAFFQRWPIKPLIKYQPTVGRSNSVVATWNIRKFCMFDLVLIWLRCDMGLSENRVPIHSHFGYYMLNPFLAMITRCNNMTQNGIWHCVLQGILHQLVDGKHPSIIPLFTMFHRNPLTVGGTCQIYKTYFSGLCTGISPPISMAL